MATVTLSSAFDTENLWATRLADAFTRTSTTYEFQSAFGFVRVTGTGFTYGAMLPQVVTGGDYTSIEVYQNANFTGLIASYSSASAADLAFFFTNGSSDALAGADTINGSSGNDTIRSRGGGDTLDGKNGSDTYLVDTSDIVPGWSLTDTGASGTDTIRLVNASPYYSYSFELASVSGIEALTFATDVDQAATFNASQLPTNLAVRGAANGTFHYLSVINATNFSAAGWTFTQWAKGFLTFDGTSGADTIVGSSKTDLIKGLGGGDNLDGAGGSDTYRLDGAEVAAGLVIHDTGASGVDTFLLRFGDYDFASAGTVISGIEVLFLQNIDEHVAFNASQLPTVLQVTLQALSGEITIQNAANFSAAKWTFQSGPYSVLSININGTSGTDQITGSTRSDRIDGNDGGDLLKGGRGNDIVLGDLGGDTLTGGLGRDVLTGGTDKDIFDFNLKTETPRGANRDVIADFSGIAGGELDRIDLRGIDANSHLAHNQKFHFIGAQGFHHKAGELHYKVDGNHVLVEGDIDGNGKADFQIEVHNLTDDLQSLAKGDFML